MGLPMPKLYITPEESPNAFATGRNPKHASIAFTQGILQLMPDRNWKAWWRMNWATSCIGTF